MATQETLGIVIKNKMDKTITVAVKKQISHKKYGKIIIKTNKYYAHDEKNECKRGDVVKIQDRKSVV